MSEWSECPRGEVVRLVHSLRRRHQNQIWLKSAGVTAGLLLMIGFASLWFRWDSTPKLACRQVRELSGQFVAGQLDDQVNQNLLVHLRHCPRCVEFVKREHPGFHLPLIDETNPKHAAGTRIDVHQIAWAASQ